MANYYSQFSEGIDDLTEKERAWIKAFLTEECPNPDDDPAKFKEWCERRHIPEDNEAEYYPNFGWSVSDSDNSMWTYSEEGCNVDHLISFVQEFLREFRPDKIFLATGADYCSKLRIGEFGGWWIAVSADYVYTGSCYDASRRAAELIAARMEKDKGGTVKSRATKGKRIRP